MQKKHTLLHYYLTRLHEVGVIVTNIVNDGPNANFVMLKELGCQASDVNNMQTWFPHPCDSNEKVFCMMDVCHMLKLVRNMFATLGTIKTPDGDVHWHFISALYKLQEEESSRLGNKLRRRHIEWHKQKMKVIRC